MSRLPLTYLFVPGNRPERFARALASEAGAVIVDLEDAVAPQDKAMAREAIAGWYRTLGEDRARVLLRINDDRSAWFEDDLALVREAAIRAVVLPKTETPSQIARVRSALTQDGYVVPLAETARGVLNLDSIAAAPGVQRLAFGTLDYAVDLDLSGDERGLLYPSCRMALASRAAGIAAPIAGVTPELGDDARLLADLAFARACGFGAKLCIHPKQVVAIHSALLPGADEVAWARRVVAAAQTSQGAVQVDGKMVDRPVIAKAMQILTRASA